MIKRIMMLVIISTRVCFGATDNALTQEDKNLIKSWNISKGIVSSLSSRAQSIFQEAKKEKRKQQIKAAIDRRDKFYLDLYAGKRVSIPLGAINEVRTVRLGKASFNVTPLMAALLGGYVHIMEYLLKNGANPNGVNKDGLTALHLAARTGFTSAVHKLLDFKANPNLQDRAGMTPLMYAVLRNTEKNHIPVIKLLLAYGAEVDTKNNQGKTAVDYAQAKHDNEIIQLLKPKTLTCDYDEDLGGITCNFGIPM